MEYLYDVLRRETGDWPGLAGFDYSQLETVASAIALAKRVFVAGMGRSGWMARAVACRLAQTGKVTHVVGDATSPACGAEDFIWVFSCTGSSAALRSYVDRAKKAGAFISLLTANPDSALAKAVDQVMVLEISASGGKSAPPMLVGTLFEYLALRAGDLAATKAAMILGQNIAAMQARHANLE